VRALHDPSGNVRGQLKLGKADSTAGVLLVDRDGKIVRTVARVAAVGEFLPDLARLLIR
jgi:hypothetical protein